MAGHLEMLAQRLTKPAEKPVAERFVQQAEKLYRSFLVQTSGHEWELVLFLGRQGRINEALRLLDRTWDTYNPAVLGQVCSTIVQGKIGQEQMERLSRTMQSAMKHFGRPIPLLMTLADVYRGRARYADAGDLDCEIIEKDNDNTIALNNLAALLAQQGTKLDEALKLINQAIKIAGPQGQLLDSRASVYIALGETDKALADLTNALAEGESAEWVFHQAQAYEQAGRHEEAAAAMEKALHMGLTKGTLWYSSSPPSRSCRNESGRPVPQGLAGKSSTPAIALPEAGLPRSSRPCPA